MVRVSESTTINELASVTRLEDTYPQLPTLVAYIPRWVFAGFRGFVGVLRDHRTKLQKTRVGAIIWVGGS